RLGLGCLPPRSTRFPYTTLFRSYYSDEEFAPLSELLAHCRSQGIPSLFWNKEDPVHFDRFRKAAALCDHVFTTDSRRIIPYLARSEEHTSELQSRENLVCRLLLE